MMLVHLFNRKILLSILIAIGYSENVISYEVVTHSNLSIESVQRSILYSNDNILDDVDMDYKSYKMSIDDTSNKYDISQVVGLGAKFEDDTSDIYRPLRHFYDPTVASIYNSGLLRIATPSPIWALEDTLDLPKQDYSLSDAKEFYYSALTKKSKELRDKNFANLFRSIGQVIHHVQDMAQPQHVRNDLHCDAEPCKSTDYFFGLYEPSLFEKYTKLHSDIVAQYYSGYETVKFNRARDYWHTDDGKGMADFTNHNFVTEETNFIDPGLSGQHYGSAGYDNPVSTGLSESYRIEDLLPKLAKQGITGEMSFISSEVTDNLTGVTDTNYNASTFSVFDRDLTKIKGCVQYTLKLDDKNQNYTYHTCRVITYNHINVAATYRYLIPRAVAYSTGLIDYFFRGRVDITDIQRETTDTGQTQYVLTIKNISQHDFDFSDGKFEVHYDKRDGTRDALDILSGADVTTLPNAAETTIKFVVPDDVDTDKENPFILVYKGLIGEEQGIAGKVFSGNSDTALLGWVWDWQTGDVGLWRSLDDGASWDIVIPGFSYYPTLNDIISTGRGKAVAILQYYSNALIYKTDDNGASWSLVEEIVNFKPTKGSGYDNTDKTMLYFATPIGFDAQKGNVKLLSYTQIPAGSYNSVTQYDIKPAYSVDEGKTWAALTDENENNNAIGLTRLEQFKWLGKKTIIAIGDRFDRNCDTCKPKYYRPAAFISRDGGVTWGPHSLYLGDSINIPKEYATFADTGRMIGLEWGSWDVIPQFHLSDDYGVSWPKAIQFNSRIDQWTYAWPWYTVYLGKGEMVAYIYDDLSLLPTGDLIPYYEAFILSNNYGEHWQEVSYRSNVAGKSSGWPAPTSRASVRFIGLGVVTKNSDKVQYVH
jgi:hypothetical protein